MNTELVQIAGLLDTARTPLEVFGPLEGGAADLKQAYLRLARLTHPDACRDPNRHATIGHPGCSRACRRKLSHRYSHLAGGCW